MRLTAEILRAYVPLARTVRGNDVQQMVSEARAVVPATAAWEPPQDTRTLAIRLGAMVSKVLAVLPTDDRCLIRSLVTLRMLEARGIPAILVLGVTTQDGFGAHAWVEHQRLPVLPTAHHDRLLEL